MSNREETTEPTGMRWDSAGSDPLEDILRALKPKVNEPPSGAALKEFGEAVRRGATDPFLGLITYKVQSMILAGLSRADIETNLQAAAEKMYGPTVLTALTVVDGRIVNYSIARPGVEFEIWANPKEVKEAV